VPNPVRVRGLIDTGASSTCIDSGSLQSARIASPAASGASSTCIDSGSLAPLGLTPTGTISMMTPWTGATPHVCNQYDIIGRDILAQCLFVYDGQAGNFSLAF
jgi:hypothetical protein